MSFSILGIDLKQTLEPFISQSLITPGRCLPVVAGDSADEVPVITGSGMFHFCGL